MAGLKLKILTRTPDLEVRAGGLKFVLFFTVVLFAAVNTGNNLTYLVLASLCGAVIVSWALAWLSLRGLSALLLPPDEVFAGEETRVEFIAGMGPSLWPGRSLTFKLRSKTPLHITHKPYITRLDQGENQKLVGLLIFPRRGRCMLGGVHAVSDYPFGLVSLGRLFRQEEETFVYPRILSIEELFERESDGYVIRDSLKRGRGGGLLNIRPFMPGDDYRQLHWKASAKLGEMMLKEYAREEGEAVWLHFNPLRRSDSSERDDERFELAVSMAASVAYHGRSLGRTMLFSAPGLRLAPVGERNHVTRFLQYLAEVEIGGRIPSETTITAMRRRGDETLIVIDPLNENLDWGEGAEVLDRSYFSARMRDEQ